MRTWRTGIGAGLAVLVLWMGGCGGDEGPAGVALDEHRWLGEPVVIDNLTVWPVHTDAPLDIGEFLTLPEAEAGGLAEVREVGGSGASQVETQEEIPEALEEVASEVASEGASPDRGRVEPQEVGQAGQVSLGGGAVVNTLVIENKGDLPILVCAGTIVKGGRQDRQIGQDFVIAARSTVPVDAFCVEPGRWQVRSGSTAAFSAVGQGVAVKSVRASAQYEKNQGKVWDEVRQVLRDTGVEGTDTLVAATEQADAKVRARWEATEQRLARHFTRLAAGEEAPVGFAYAVDGAPVTVRVFAHSRLLERQLPAFVKAMCMEADLAERGRSEDAEAPPPASAAAVVAFVQAINRAEERRERTKAANGNVYREAAEGFSGACYLLGEDGKALDAAITVDWTAR